jgi:hypothetical protein
MKFIFTDPTLPAFIEYFLIEGAVKLTKQTGKDIHKLWPDMFDKSNNKEWELKIMLNGVELPALEMFKHMDQQFDEMVAKRSHQLIKEKFSRINEMVEDFEELILGQLQKEFPDYALDDDDYK